MLIVSDDCIESKSYSLQIGFNPMNKKKAKYINIDDYAE